jgi:hypothetical protein
MNVCKERLFVDCYTARGLLASGVDLNQVNREGGNAPIILALRDGYAGNKRLRWFWSYFFDKDATIAHVSEGIIPELIIAIARNNEKVATLIKAGRHW